MAHVNCEESGSDTDGEIAALAPSRKKAKTSVDEAPTAPLAELLGKGYGQTEAIPAAAPPAETTGTTDFSAAFDSSPAKEPGVFSAEAFMYSSRNFQHTMPIFSYGSSKSKNKRAKKKLAALMAGTANPNASPQIQLMRDKLTTMLSNEGRDFVHNERKQKEALDLFSELVSNKDIGGLFEVVQACAHTGRHALDVLKEVFIRIKECQSKENLISVDMYRKLVDHLALSTDSEFGVTATSMLIDHRIGPRLSEFVSMDAQEYFLRQSTFLNMELAEEVKATLDTINSSGKATHVEVYRSTIGPGGMIMPGTGEDNLWEILPRQSWNVPRDRFREDGQVRGGTPVRGDLIFIISGSEVVISIVLEVIGKDTPLPSAMVAVEQYVRMQRFMRNHGPKYAVVGGSKVAYDRMRNAIFELSRKQCKVPAMQQWLVLRPSTADGADRDSMADVPKDGQARLWIRTPEGQSSIEACGAEWTDMVLPGSRLGTVAFFPDNAFGVDEFEQEGCKGKIVVCCRGECSFADKVRNAASAGALAVIVVDSGEATELFPMQRDEKPQAVNLPPGMRTGFKVEFSDDTGSIVITEVDEDCPVYEQIVPGLVVEGIDGDPDLSSEELEHVLSNELPLREPLRIFVRLDKAVPAIPAVLIRRDAGEKLVRLMTVGQAEGTMPAAEIHVAELEDAMKQGLSESAQAQLNGPQVEAIQAGLRSSARIKGGGHVSLIQGPPGTGKTTCALHIISYWVADEEWNNSQKGSKILVTGFSNIAIDNIALGLQKLGVGPILRVGRGQSLLNSDTLEAKVKAHHAYNHLEMLREGARLQGGFGRARGEMRKMEKSVQGELVSAAKVILCTCISSGGEILQGQKFPRVLFDEATQATEPASLVPLLKICEELVLLGDQAQLPPTVVSDRARRLGLTESLFERLVRLGVPHKMLRIQYRMHPALAAFPSRAFYGGLLSNGIRGEDRLAPLGYPWPKRTMPLCFEGVGNPGQCLEEHVGASRQNKQEALRVVDIIAGFLKAGELEAEDIAVISPYAAQVALLRRLLNGMPGANGLQVSSVDSFQGMERDLIVCSTVRSKGGSVGFLQDRRRFNVLLTRAKRGMLVLGHQQTLLSDPCWGKWVEHCLQLKLGMGQVTQITTPLPELKPTQALDENVENAISEPGRWMEFGGDSWIRKTPPPQPVVKAKRKRIKHEVHVTLVTPPGQPLPPPMPRGLVQNTAKLGENDELRTVVQTEAGPAGGAAEATQPTQPTQSIGHRVTFNYVTAVAQRLLLDNAHTCFSQLGEVPIDFKSPMPNMHTAAIVLMLPGKGSSVAKAAAKTKIEAAARCCARACQILAEADLMESEVVAELQKDMEKAEAYTKELKDSLSNNLAGEPPVHATVRGCGSGWGSAATVKGGCPITNALHKAAGSTMHPKQIIISMKIFGGNQPPPIQLIPEGFEFVAHLQLPPKLGVDPKNGGLRVVSARGRNRKDAEKNCCAATVELIRQIYNPG